MALYHQVEKRLTMGRYINNGIDYFQAYMNDTVFVDKSDLIRITNAALNTKEKFICVTRPRRFGKSMAIGMLANYYSKGSSFKEMFDRLRISKDPSYLIHLNQHNVIDLDMTSFYCQYYREDYLKRMTENVIADLDESFPGVLSKEDDTISKAIRKIHNTTGERFIILIDEWNLLFREVPKSKACDKYLRILKSFINSSVVSSVIEMICMTGILSMRKNDAKNNLSNMDESSMIHPGKFGQYFGFTQNEVKTLCDEFHIDFKKMKQWYEGYNIAGMEIYNPLDVCDTIQYEELYPYWTNTGALESLTNYMNYDHGVLKGTIAKMTLGEKVPVNVSNFSNDLTKIDSADAALTVLIHLGYLAYDEENKSCSILNYEIRLEFEKALKELKWNETYDPISNSKKLYEETLKGNIAFIDETLDKNHKEFASMYNMNKEDVLSLVVHISYYSLIDDYFIREEDTCTPGRADLTFTPRDESHIQMIVELKADASPEEALNQIRNRDYASLFKGYKGKILLLGISYDSKSLKHESRVEFVEI